MTEESYTEAICNPTLEVLQRYRRLARSRFACYRQSLGTGTFRLLEVGCGAAGLADELRRCGVDYRGLDLDHRPIAAARARGIDNVEVADFMELRIPDRRYDVICFSQVLEHITDPRAFIERARCLLAPGGILHLDVPHHLSLAGLSAMLIHLGTTKRARFGGIEYPHHSFAYHRRTLRTLLARGFDARVFTARPDNPLWGQAVVPNLRTRAYYLASQGLGCQSLLVGYAIRAKGDD